jgi:pimeloyl-ACP methyl ester carboxylesterase
VRVLGSGSPTLLLHGLMGSNRYWGGAFDCLAENGALIVPDLLGFGASPRPASGYGPEEHGRAVIESLRDLNVVEPALVVGHSLGALIAIWMAYNHPDRVRGVVAFAPPLFRDARHARRQMAKLGAVERLFALQSRATTWVATLACSSICSAHPRLAVRLYALARPAILLPVLEDAIRHSWVSYSQTVARVILAAEGARWLASARVPIVVIAGTRDRHLDVEFLRDLVDACPPHNLEVWEGDGHDLPLFRPDRCVAAIERFRTGAPPRLTG